MDMTRALETLPSMAVVAAVAAVFVASWITRRILALVSLTRCPQDPSTAQPQVGRAAPEPSPDPCSKYDAALAPIQSDSVQLSPLTTLERLPIDRRLSYRKYRPSSCMQVVSRRQSSCIAAIPDATSQTASSTTTPRTAVKSSWSSWFTSMCWSIAIDAGNTVLVVFVAVSIRYFYSSLHNIPSNESYLSFLHRKLSHVILRPSS